MRDADQSHGEQNALGAAISRLHAEIAAYKISSDSSGVLCDLAAKDVSGACRISVAISGNICHPDIETGLIALSRALFEVRKAEDEQPNFLQSSLVRQLAAVEALKKVDVAAPHVKDWGLFIR